MNDPTCFPESARVANGTERIADDMIRTWGADGALVIARRWAEKDRRYDQVIDLIEQKQTEQGSREPVAAAAT